MTTQLTGKRVSELYLESVQALEGGEVGELEYDDVAFSSALSKVSRFLT